MIAFEEQVFSQMLHEEHRDEILKCLQTLNAETAKSRPSDQSDKLGQSGQLDLGRLASKLVCYAGGLRKHDALAKLKSISVLEIGAGTAYLFNFFLLKSLFPAASIRFVAVDIDAAAARQHSKAYRGDEIFYLVVNATEIGGIQRLSGLGQKSVDVVFLDRPVVCSPDDYAEFFTESENSEAGSIESAGSTGSMRAEGPNLHAMQQALEDPGYAQSMRQQVKDFQKVFDSTLPFFLKPEGVICASSLLPEEFSHLEARLAAESLVGNLKCLYRPGA